MSAPAATTPAARLFFALWPPAGVAAELSALAARAVAVAGGRATRQETIHLTLAFLGDVDSGRLDALRGAAAAVRGTSFDLVLDRAAIWRHNRIYQVGCPAPPPALAALVEALNAALGGVGLAPADGGRRFVPHVTLARKVRDVSAAPPACPPLRWRCDRFVLVRSRLSAAGPDYERLAEFPLAGA